jgi:hypothetical protein
MTAGHSTALIVAETPIMQDAQGRYSLNTLHHASQTGPEKRPSEWLRRKTTKALITELASQSVDLRLDVVKGGDGPGTYAHELLAISYAGWISPACQLKVNQAFIDMRTGKARAVQPMTAIQLIAAQAHALVEMEQRQLATEAAVTVLETKLAALDSETGYRSVTGWQRTRNVTMSLDMAKTFGKEATAKCKALGIRIGKVPSEQWGSVGSYPVQVLDELWQEQQHRNGSHTTEHIGRHAGGIA